eukprot:scaffold6558_cov136-Isochrysis_galbana.AAC.1
MRGLWQVLRQCQLCAWRSQEVAQAVAQAGNRTCTELSSARSMRTRFVPLSAVMSTSFSSTAGAVGAPLLTSTRSRKRDEDTRIRGYEDARRTMRNAQGARRMCASTGGASADGTAWQLQRQLQRNRASGPAVERERAQINTNTCLQTPAPIPEFSSCPPHRRPRPSPAVLFVEYAKERSLALGRRHRHGTSGRQPGAGEAGGAPGTREPLPGLG